ncbi:MAG: DNA polymerase III subunit delta' [Candidatus Omnitrophica bacterium]|nr:DNA polymerase III subunit delta' [Candidatus Omnitrophota bacterium]
MILLNDIKGQESAVRYLLNSRASGRMAGSYLFSGPAGVGRALTAKAFLASLACERGREQACMICPSCRRVWKGEHPDVKWIRPEKNKNIKIDTIRDIKAALGMKPFEAPFNACVIEDAHMMTTEASNALLKVLEEPPGASMLILITDRKEWLLTTVVSRCSEVRFRRLSAEDSARIVSREAGVPGKEALFLSHLSQGSPGRALEMIEEGVLDRKDILLDLVEEIAKEKNPSCMNWPEEKRDALIEDIEIVLIIFRELVFRSEGLEDLMLDREAFEGRDIRAYPAERVYKILGELVSVKKSVSGNINAKLAAQVLPGMLS